MKDIVLDKMKAEGVELTRENYLLFAFFDAGVELDAEAESMLPEEFQDWTPR
ncbi:MAG TPA: hypothetical protein VIX91_15010 [Candidatus Acidoferrum sp.]